MIWCPRCNSKAMPEGGDPCENCGWPEAEKRNQAHEEDR